MTSSPSKKMSSNIQYSPRRHKQEYKGKAPIWFCKSLKKIEQKQHYSLTLLCNKNSNESRKKASFLPWVIYFFTRQNYANWKQHMQNSMSRV